MNKIEVAGEFSPDVPALLADAEIVLASARILRDPRIPVRAVKIPVDGAILENLPAILKRAETEKTVVLASGDPLFSGLGSTLLKRIPSDSLRFHPGVSAFQILFSRIGEPWDRVRLFSLHAKTALPFRAILRSELCAVYGDAKRPAGAVAETLIRAFPPAALRRAACGTDLGTDSEAVMTGSLAEIAADARSRKSLSVLALLPDGGPAPEPPPGLPDAVYEHHKNMITHPEVRAVVLSKLRSGGGRGVLWDLGAGSGAVGLEAAGIAPGLCVYAVEKDSARFEQLARNAEREGLENFNFLRGDASEVMETLPPPDRIFIGGGGRVFLEKAFGCLRPGGILVMTGVTAATVSLLTGRVLAECRSELLAIQVSRADALETGDLLFRAENPVTVAVYRKPGEKGSVGR